MSTAQATMREYAGQRWPSLNHKGRIARLASTLGIGHRRVRSLYQNEPGVRLRADEQAVIAALRARKIDEANQDDFMALQARVARLEALLATVGASLADDTMAGEGEVLDVGRGEYVPVVYRPEDHDQSRG